MGVGILLYNRDYVLTKLCNKPVMCNMILELILKICHLKLIYQKESGLSMALKMHIKIRIT